ncbi:sulfotransferase [Thermosulfurimonas sp. F29]|uniref:sulfotransferase family protein n=1 Tax=Thermosulfurimonas sp. F29 TaxID=2867247 RepID=UPI001C83F679|nr:sulfotransferase [Thermosulfurimonas sp. F29]MBX6423459.1 sulfotransferase [Thermosulfurimonas sp. F29]
MKNFKYIAGLVYKTSNIMLSHIENFLACNVSSNNFKNPPLFIIGAPRSGTTILYQILINNFEYGFLSNLHCFFYGFPSLVQFFLRILNISVSCIPYHSHYGYVSGFLSPSECGSFWYRWFPKSPDFVEYVPAGSLRKMRKVLIFLERLFDRPLLFKNVYNSLRLQHFLSVMPESKFIVVKRKIYYNALSILIARVRISGSLSNWFSVKPPDIKANSPYEEVLDQIAAIYKYIEHFINVYPDKFLVIKLEDLVDNPQEELIRISSFYPWVRTSRNYPRFEGILNSSEVNKDLSVPEINTEKLKALVIDRFGNLDSYP